MVVLQIIKNKRSVGVFEKLAQILRMAWRGGAKAE
jgi:hypothetical protein